MSTSVTGVPGFSNRQLWMVLGALMLAVLLAAMEISIIATALPTIAGEFNAFESFAWVGTAYIAASAIGTPLLGKLSDLYGRRQVFRLHAWRCSSSARCCAASSQNMGHLIAARTVQGFGGGAIQALAFAILGDILPPRERGRYIGYFTLAFVGAALLGPLIGGFIIDQWSWPWIFLINVPLGAIAGVVSYIALELPFPRRKAATRHRRCHPAVDHGRCADDRARGGRHGRLDRTARPRAVHHPARRAGGVRRWSSGGRSSR